MALNTSDVPAGTRITSTRTLLVKQAGLSPGILAWQAHEFDDGHFMLTANAQATSFGAHFTGEQWAAFQDMVAPAAKR